MPGGARAQVGDVSDFGDDHFLEPLDVLITALENEAQLTVLGRWITRRFLLRILEGRLQMSRTCAAIPVCATRRSRAPLFVAGAPRTGTTILYSLLVQDAAHRAPRGWELLRPVPPPDPDPERVRRTTPASRWPTASCGCPRSWSTASTRSTCTAGGSRRKCLSSMSFEFQSEEFTTRYDVPSYIDWLARCDMRPAYDTHKLILQILQRRFADVQWVLKSPVHMRSLPTLLVGVPRRADRRDPPRPAAHPAVIDESRRGAAVRGQ